MVSGRNQKKRERIYGVGVSTPTLPPKKNIASWLCLMNRQTLNSFSFVGLLVQEVAAFPSEEETRYYIIFPALVFLFILVLVFICK